MMIFVNISHAGDKLVYETIHDPAALMPTIQKMRFNTYAPFPYLYALHDASAEDTSFYNAHTKIVVVKKNNHVVALAVALPLENFQYDEFSAKKQLVPQLGSKIKDYLLISEILFSDHPDIVNAKYEIGTQLLKHMERAVDHTQFKHLCVLVVERSLDHPLYLKNYFDETKILKKANYKKTDWVVMVPWTTKISNDQSQYQDNPTRLWEKRLNTGPRV
jgi:hypothetical protein